MNPPSDEAAEIRFQHLRGMITRSLDISFFMDINKENFHDKMEFLTLFVIGTLDQWDSKDRTELAKEIKDLKEALRFYGQTPKQESGTKWSDSCEEWGEISMTWEPLIDLGKRAREVLAKYDGEK